MRVISYRSSGLLHSIIYNIDRRRLNMLMYHMINYYCCIGEGCEKQIETVD